MPTDLSVSIIVCTRNRAAALKQTLGTLGKVRIPSGWRAEVLVVDNGSTDDTETVAGNAYFQSREARYLYEPRTGKSHALNTGLAQARGEIILATDDDLDVPEDWVEQLLSGLVDGGYDAVTGRITLASHLVRPWMSDLHRCWLAASDNAPLHEGSRELIGASMGFRRSVLERVPAFDPELGPGGLGNAEDTLFGWQLAEAGFKIGYVAGTAAVHHFDPSRLRRADWLNHARRRGRSRAYLQYHWEHEDLRHTRRAWLVRWAKLWVKRVLQRPPSLLDEGCPEWELHYVFHMELCRQFRRERQRPRNYSRRGLAKRFS